MAHIYWEEIYGNVTVTARGLNENDVWEQFTFDCYISEEVNSYDRLSYVNDIACAMVRLRNLGFAEVVDVKKVIKNGQ